MRPHFLSAALLTGILLGSASFLSTAQPSQPPAYQWATGAYAQATSGAAGSAGTTATAMGVAGETYVAYRHTFPLVVGGQTFSNNSPQQFNAVLLRHDPNGTVAGSRLLVVNGEITDLATDATGSLYALARFRGSATIGSTVVTPTAAGRPDYLIVKWDAAGNHQWHVQGTTASYFGQTYYDRLSVDALGRVAVVGAVTSSLTLGAFTLAPTGTTSTLFCAQLDAGGNVLWAKAATGVASPGAWPTDIAADPATGTLLLGGSGRAGFGWPSTATTTTPVGTAGDRVFWMRLDAASGALLNDFSAPTTGFPSVLVAPAENGNSYLAFSTSAQSPALQLNGAPVVIPSGAFAGGVVARLDPSGVPQWVEVMASGDSSSVQINSLAAAPAAGALRTTSGAAQCYIGGSYSYFNAAQPLTGLTLPQPTGWNAGFVSARDGMTGAETWSVPVGQSGRASDIGFLSLSPTASGELALAGQTNSDLLTFNSIQVAFPTTVGWNRGFAAKLVQTYNTLTGLVYVDSNANGLFDGTDEPAPGTIVQEQTSGLAYSTSTTGDYAAAVGLGAYALTLPNPPLYYSVVAAPATASFSSYGNVSAGHDFALQPVPNQQDLRVSLTPVNRARPGFPLEYRVTYRNVGTVALASGDVTLALPAALTYLSTSGGGTLSGSVLTTPYANLLPGQTRDFNVLCQVPTTTLLGTLLTSTATVGPLAGDLTPADNTETSTLTVVGSYDPNDIQVNYATLTPSQVTAGEWLEYTVRFQNLGTDTAFSILLRDALPATLLNLGTLQLIASSHSCTWGLAPDGMLSVSFTNVRLPHRAVNTVGSMGFVRFRVKPRGTLVLGDLIPNAADIHFDFNAPVTTNTALTEVSQPTGLPNAADALAGAVWPNPATDRLHVEATLPAAATLRLTLLDAVGRTARTLTAATASGLVQQELELGDLPAGLYLLRAEAGAIGFTRRVVVK